MGDVPDSPSVVPGVHRSRRQPNPGASPVIDHRGKKDRPGPNHPPSVPESTLPKRRRWLGRHRLLRWRSPAPPMVAKSQSRSQRGGADQIGKDPGSGPRSPRRGTGTAVAGFCGDVSRLPAIRAKNHPPIPTRRVGAKRMTGTALAVPVITQFFISKN